LEDFHRSPQELSFNVLYLFKALEIYSSLKLSSPFFKDEITYFWIFDGKKIATKLITWKKKRQRIGDRQEAIGQLL